MIVTIKSIDKVSYGRRAAASIAKYVCRVVAPGNGAARIGSIRVVPNVTIPPCRHVVATNDFTSRLLSPVGV